MKRRVSVLAALVGVAAVALVAIGAMGASAADRAPQRGSVWAQVATGASAEADAAAAGAQRLVVREVGGRFVFIDADGSGGESEGDYFAGTSNLVQGGERIGRDWVKCTLQFGFSIQCEATALIFGRGTIELAGTVNDRHNRVAITGGTGEWADAGGEMTLAEEPRLIFSILHLD